MSRYPAPMPLILCGIDEAGYGPTLGPLCVGLAVLRINDWDAGEKVPNLWTLLRRGVARQISRSGRRVVIADSKLLKLPNDSKTRHPLLHLERGVLSAGRCAGLEAGTDADLLAGLGTRLGEGPWYAGEPFPLPLGSSPEEVAIAANLLAGTLDRAGVGILQLRCTAVGECVFNQIIRETGSKAEATLGAVRGHLRRILAEHAAGEPVQIVCDRLGGRTSYGPFLERDLSRPVTTLEESGRASRYDLGDGVRVAFAPEAERRSLAVALASMLAKYVRELAMARFNRYWCARAGELKPTAGYHSDARRWLADVAGVVSEEERAAMVRIA